MTKVELPVATGEFADGSSTFTLPSWAPGSSSELAQWSARLTIHRGGRDIDTRGDFNVVIGTADLMVTDEPQQRINGDGETAVDIVLPTLLHRAGETSQVIKLGNGIPLRNGTPVTVRLRCRCPKMRRRRPVHSSLVWFLEATLMYSKWTQGIEKVRRQIVVVNAP